MQGRESFPPDVLAQILLRLPARSVRRFRCVSKLFLALTSDPSFTYSHALRNANPLLLIQAQPLYDLTNSIALYLFDASSSHGVDEIALPPPRTKSFPRNENPNLKLVASCNGFLCFRGSSSNSNYYVANPITKDWLFLPKSDNSEMGFLCGFYLHYPAGDYRLLLTVAGLGFEVCTVGSHSDSWRRIGWPDYNVPSCSIDCPVLLHGCLHWMGSKHDAFRSSTANGIVAFDTKLEEFRQISHPNSSRSMNRNHLLEIEGSLGLCQVKEESVMEIWVMKDYEREVWIKQHVVSTLHAGRPHLLEQRYFLRPVTSTSSDGEIWLGWFSTNSWYPDSLILCNFKTNTLTKVETRSRIPWRYYTISPVAYLDSLAFDWKL